MHLIQAAKHRGSENHFNPAVLGSNPIGIRIRNLAEIWKTSPPSQKDVDNKFATKLQNCKLCRAIPFPLNCTFNVFLCND